MTVYSTNEFKSGLKVLLDQDPYVILENEFVKPGKGQAFNRVKLRHLRSGRVLQRTLKSGETLEAADVLEQSMQYLYFDGYHWHFMVPETCEQYEIDAQVLSECHLWLKAQEQYIVTLWNNNPLTVTPPHFVVLKITQTDPGLKGDTSGGGGKPATLETGAVIRVPLFIQASEYIKVDTRNAEYVCRAKE